MHCPHRLPVPQQRQQEQQQQVIQHILANVGPQCREELMGILQSPPEEQAKMVRGAAVVAAQRAAAVGWPGDADRRPLALVIAVALSKLPLPSQPHPSPLFHTALSLPPPCSN